MRALRTAATGMAAQQLNVEVISNNIANMNTVAYKKQRAEFQDLLYQSIERPGSQSSDAGTIVPTGVQVGSGVKAGSVYRIGTQGSATRTDNPYDMMVQGRGYFQVKMPSGENSYTRAGNFAVNGEGKLVKLKRDDENWMKHTFGWLKPDGAVELKYRRPYIITEHPEDGWSPEMMEKMKPKERKY